VRRLDSATAFALAGSAARAVGQAIGPSAGIATALWPDVALTGPGVAVAATSGGEVVKLLAYLPGQFPPTSRWPSAHSVDAATRARDPQPDPIRPQAGRVGCYG
jgi:hypothetical protein